MPEKKSKETAKKEMSTNEMRRYAQKINGLIKETSDASKNATRALQQMSGAYEELDRQLAKLINDISQVNSFDPALNDLRELRVNIGINKRVANGLTANSARIKSISARSLVVS